MIEIIFAGGWMMIPILACSVISLTIIVERFFFFNNRKLLDQSWVIPIWQEIRQKGRHSIRKDALKQMKKRGVMGNFVYSLLSIKTREKMEQLLDYESYQLESLMKEHLYMLGTISVLSPLLGLLGTVIGIIDVFNDLSLNLTDLDPGQLSSGISVALITTAAGLIVAIPSTFFHRYFIHKSSVMLYSFLHQSNLLIDAISEDGEIEKS